MVLAGLGGMQGAGKGALDVRHCYGSWSSPFLGQDIRQMS